MLHQLDIPFKTIIKPTVSGTSIPNRSLDIPFKTMIKPTIAVFLLNVPLLDIPFKTMIKPTLSEYLYFMAKLDIPFKTTIKPTLVSKFINFNVLTYFPSIVSYLRLRTSNSPNQKISSLIIFLRFFYSSQYFLQH